MYLCEDCFFVFENPKTESVNHGTNSSFCEHFLVCPRCCGEFNKIIGDCASCGEHLTDIDDVTVIKDVFLHDRCLKSYVIESFTTENAARPALGFILDNIFCYAEYLDNL